MYGNKRSKMYSVYIVNIYVECKQRNASSMKSVFSFRPDGDN
jgi:hypothetical protein